MSDYPTQNPDESTAHYLHRLVHEENLGSNALADALVGADLQAADLVIAAANESKRRQEDFSIDVDVDFFREEIGEEITSDLNDEEIRQFIQGILDSEGFLKLLRSEAKYWFLRQQDEDLDADFSPVPETNEE
jgi:hypothetical protein